MPFKWQMKWYSIVHISFKLKMKMKTEKMGIISNKKEYFIFFHNILSGFLKNTKLLL